MELGKLVSLTIMGEYEFPDIELADSMEWTSLCEKAGVCPSYGTAIEESEFDGFENEVFVIRPYDWNEPTQPLPNFHHKITGFKIWWYKYAFRSSDMNMNLSVDEIKDIFSQCLDSLTEGAKTPVFPTTKKCETADELIDLLEEKIHLIMEYNRQIKMLSQEVNFVMNCDKTDVLPSDEVEKFNELSEESEALMIFNSLKRRWIKPL